ncbi:MAG TPA: hypothetical protein VHY22_17100 [Chthoniobacteraceae bacterium]|jgi:hypothetical protein|nr:hypothetical protein [Chthoniobacteraceae bacterium]
MKGFSQFLRAAALLCLCTAAVHAGVVRPAPDFKLDGIPKTLHSLRGQPVVLIIAQKMRLKEFKKELFLLGPMYPRFSEQKVVFVAAIEHGPTDIHSNIPFANAANPSQVAADYGVNGRFAIAVIGVDGNLDLITARPISAARVRDMIINNYETQASSRAIPGL